jgi:structural maintenance of chromosome 1
MRGIHHLELFNFKSYRGKHTIGPFKNFSAVVGPNGSGKSNVMDAITFVLGVAAGKIRADQVKELINSYGPDNDTPNTNAYVEMVFENDDGTKVHFRRSIRLVTRSGAGAGGDATVSDTTYAVDGITVPKKTYEQRLNALGITVRTSLSGFQTFPNFLVPQNEVALVAQKTPQQLAQFIEVVSGSAEHARAYDEAEAAMRATEDSFMQAFRQKQSTNREHRQVRELVKEAAEFRAKLDTHAALKNEFYLVQMYYTDKELVAAQEQAKGLRARLRAAEEVAARAAVALEDEQKALGDARRALGKVERQRGEHMRAIVDAQPTAGQLAEQARFLKKTVRDCEAKQQQLAQLREERAAQLRGLERELAELKAAQKRFESQTAAEAARGGVVAPAVLAEYHAIKARVEEETATLREGLAALQRKHTATKAAHAAAETAATAVGRNLASVEASLQAAEVRRAAAATVVEESRAAWEAEKVTLAALEQRGETSVARKEELLARIARNNQAMADAAVDEVQVARLSRLNDSLSTLKALYPGLIRGRLSDLVQPVSGEYNRAVSVALGRDLDAIVVADDDTAFKCMDYLKRQRAGIATFLPLASLRVQPPSEYLRQLIGGSLKLVLDVVTYSDVDKKAVLYACGNALVARDLDEARRFQFGDMGARIRRALAEANESGGGGDDDDDGAPGPGAGGGQRFKVVTLDGSILHKSGNMTGGVRASGGNDRYTAFLYSAFHCDCISFMFFFMLVRFLFSVFIGSRTRPWRGCAKRRRASWKSWHA